MQDSYSIASSMSWQSLKRHLPSLPGDSTIVNSPTTSAERDHHYDALPPHICHPSTLITHNQSCNTIASPNHVCHQHPLLHPNLPLNLLMKSWHTPHLIPLKNILPLNATVRPPQNILMNTLLQPTTQNSRSPFPFSRNF